MAQQSFQLDHDRFSCSICLDLLKDPVTIPCGHSYCMGCIQTHWDGQQKNVHGCPQCRQTFRPRPVLVKNTMLADLVEELKKAGHGPSAADHCYAGAGDVACDFCTGKKLKAVKSCLQCLVSYCRQHLQPHFESTAFKKHKLVDPSEKLHENVCPRHDEVMKMFCRTDQQFICYLCSMDEHKGHDAVTSAAARVEKQAKLEESRRKLHQRIGDKQTHIMTLQQKVETIGRSANETLKKNNGILTELIRLLEERRPSVERQVRLAEEEGVVRVKELESKLDQEVSELRRKDKEMEKLSRVDDHVQFLLQYPSVSKLDEDPGPPDVRSRPLTRFEDVTTAVEKLREILVEGLREGWTDVAPPISPPPVPLKEPEPELQTRADFLQYLCDITMDPNTASTWLSLSKQNKRVTVLRDRNKYPKHPDRFSDLSQVLSTEGLTGRCYWEVKMRGRGGLIGGVHIAVTTKDIQRKGISNRSRFGRNDFSWVLQCLLEDYEACHNRVVSVIPGPVSSRVGVFLDHPAGVLSFYAVTETMTLLHTFHTTFTEPLYVGLMLLCFGNGAEFK